jgi:hypothetical protein
MRRKYVRKRLLLYGSDAWKYAKSAAKCIEVA